MLDLASSPGSSQLFSLAGKTPVHAETKVEPGDEAMLDHQLMAAIKVT